VTAAGELLAEEIRRNGPIPFRRFMEVALYHPEHGYYSRPRKTSGRDPFGRTGDFFTAEQMQPVFGQLIAARIRHLFQEMGSPSDFTIVELGAGRGEMAPAYAEWCYVPVEIHAPVAPAILPPAEPIGLADSHLPDQVRGVFFSNEFFDALPVEAVVFLRGEFRRRLVASKEGRFVWTAGDLASPELDAYLRRFFPPPVEGIGYEANLEALNWIECMSRALRSGYVLSIDYGYTRAEAVRFPRGTLMSYRRHTAREDVLADPGEQDITAHVNFSALAERGEECGLRTDGFETLAQALIAAGEDEFARSLAALDAAEQLRRRLQLKTLLFGMGETFRILRQRKEGRGIGGESP
jgi:SAM-dependent MidA family methyltransferase